MNMQPKKRVVASNFSIDELRIKQGEFEGIRQNLEKEIKKSEKERQGFLTKFPIPTIGSLTIDQYKVRSETKNSFCYLLETKLKALGNMHGATAFKFGIYYGKKISDPTERYRWVPRFGDTEEEAFVNVRTAIVNLLDAARRQDFEAIEQNELSPMFKGKILATYYPENFLNIFAREHLEFFLAKLGIYYDEKTSEVKERKLLMDFKNGDSVMTRWTVYEFSAFLYHTFGRPPKKAVAQEELKEYVEDPREYPQLSNVKAKVINLGINIQNAPKSEWHPQAGRPPIDFEREARIHKKLGNQGEQIVLQLEKQHFEKLGKKELAKKIRWVSQESDSLGYDILSFEDDGMEKRIEVKSTARSPETTASFLISNNQYRQAKKLENYYFYVVFETRTTQPKIWPIKDPLSHENKGLTLEPVSFRVTINTKP